MATILFVALAILATATEPENQATPNFNIEKQSDQSLAVSTAIYEWLAQGETLDAVRVRAYNAYNGENKPDSPEELLRLWGDFYTKIKGVYYGPNWAEDSEPLAWFRSE